MFTDIQSIYGGAKISLDGCGDSTPRYAIYQLDAELNYRKIGTWNHENGNSRLKLDQVVTPLQQRKEETELPGGVSENSTLCLPTCLYPDKPVMLQSDGGFLDDCCRSCHRLDANEIFIEGRNEVCKAGFWPNKNQTECEKINNSEEEDDIPNYDRTATPVITVDILSFFFLLVIMAFSVLFFIKRTDPIVCKSGKLR